MLALAAHPVANLCCPDFPVAVLYAPLNGFNGAAGALGCAGTVSRGIVTLFRQGGSSVDTQSLPTA